MRTIAPVTGPDKTYIANTAVLRGTVAKVGTTPDGAVQANGVGQRGIGIFNRDAAGGVGVVVTRYGDAIAIAGGAATRGQYAKSDASGKVIASTDAAGSGAEIVGRFESDAAASGDEVVLFVHPFIL